MDAISTLANEISQAENEQLLSIPAKRLREKLIPLKSKEEHTAKRWFWELLQNASDYNDSVNVSLEIDNNKVTFKHTGKPFTIQDVLNLTCPDSGKDKDEIKKENIGKFGSGLVSTHILSAEIIVDGAYRSQSDNRLYPFHLALDRSSYDNKELLIQSIEKAKESIRHPKETIDESLYKGFMTSFSYNLNKRLPGLNASLDVISIGLNHIYEVLPYTLCFMPKVKSVEIQDKRNNATIRNYSIKIKKSSNTGITFTIIQDQTSMDLEFIKLQYQQVETVYHHKNGAVQPYPKNIPKLFCGLPMIGSEEIGLPIIINSLQFEPTIEREGVEITVNDTTNIKLFKQASSLYQLLLKDVSTNNLENAYYLAKLSNKYIGVEGSKNIFKRDFVPAFHKIIEESVIVKNADGKLIKFKEQLLPCKEGKIFSELYQYALEIKRSRLPSIESYEGWVNTVDFTLFPDQKYNLTSFIEEISLKEHIKSIVLHSNINSTDWLHHIISLVCEEDDKLLQDYSLLPNQKGVLKKSKDLFLDNDLPEELKKILNSLSSEDIEHKLLDRSFNTFEHIIDKQIGLSELCNNIDTLLKDKYSQDKGSTKNFNRPLNDLYKWITGCTLSNKNIEELFSWFYPRRATLFMDTFGDKERDYAFTIVQSGKMKALAILAESNISIEELEYIGKNPDMMTKLYAILEDEVDDKQNANLATGDYGETLVYNDLRKKYKHNEGYEVIWASKKGEARFDFEVKYHNKTIFYIDAKTTLRGIANSDSIPFFMRQSQWAFLPTIDEDTKYLIARVFKKEEIIKYLEINLLKNCV